MSNCIHILRGDLRLKASHIDLPKLQALLNSVKGLEKAPTGEDDETTRRYYAWWFLDGCTAIVANYTCIISFGNGRSIHTYRDFKGLVQSVLSHLARKDFDFKVLVQDEDTAVKPYWLQAKVRVSI